MTTIKTHAQAAVLKVLFPAKTKKSTRTTARPQLNFDNLMADLIK